jgi:GntR family transcriptional regulator/MocR family aminotransferase
VAAESTGDALPAHGSDFLQLDIGDAPAGGKAQWLARRLRQAVADGRLAVGSRLPPTRVLAGELRVSRGVVTEAYRRLAEEGHVEGRRRGGTVVVAAPHLGGGSSDSAASRLRPATPGPLFEGEPDAAVFDALRATPARIDFTPGQPDLAAFPRAAWLRAERAVLAELSAEHLGYGDPRGAPRLRRAVADWLARSRGIRVEPDDVLIVAGTAQALTLLNPVLHADGVHAVAVEEPGSLGTRQHLRNGGMATPPVPVDEHGVRVDALRATGAGAVLLTPAHQFPTGVVTSGERRRELLRWARDGGLIVEDDYDAEHRYDRSPVPALRALVAEQVCYTGSVSKLLAPALRTGWMVPPPRHRDALTEAKRFTDLGNAVLPQLVLARLMESGDLERHLRLLRGRHRRRRDAMIAALRAHLPGAVVHGAAAGLHLTVTYGPDVPDTALAAAALARGVKCQPLSWHRQLPGRPGLVLGYAATPPGVIPDGIAALGEALRGLA